MTNKSTVNTNALMNAMVAVTMFSIAAVFPELAFAQTGLANISNDLAVNVNNGVLPIISIGSYVGGTVLGVSTLLDAKKYSENPGQNGPLGKIVTKGAVSAGLFSLPTVMGNIQDSLFTKGDKADYNQTTFKSPINGQ